MSSICETWGTKPEERRVAFPCDGIIHQPDVALYRGVTVNAPQATVFRWLCQMRAAPYSYDWLDNGGRQSPRALTTALENLVIGQDVMRIFNLIAFEKDRHLTLRLKPKSSASRTFGDIAVSYVLLTRVDDRSVRSCRLLVKLIAKYPRGLYGRIMRFVLPWGDLIMMRRQLLNLKKLAEDWERCSDFGLNRSLEDFVRGCGLFAQFGKRWHYRAWHSGNAAPKSERCSDRKT